MCSMCPQYLIVGLFFMNYHVSMESHGGNQSVALLSGSTSLTATFSPSALVALNSCILLLTRKMSLLGN